MRHRFLIFRSRAQQVKAYNSGAAQLICPKSLLLIPIVVISMFREAIRATSSTSSRGSPTTRFTPISGLMEHSVAIIWGAHKIRSRCRTLLPWAARTLTGLISMDMRLIEHLISKTGSRRDSTDLRLRTLMLAVWESVPPRFTRSMPRSSMRTEIVSTGSTLIGCVLPILRLVSRRARSRSPQI